MDERVVKGSKADKGRPRHLAPNVSKQHIKIRKDAREAHQDEELLRNILWLIGAHDKLLGLGRIARNLLKILASRREPSPRFAGWPKVLQWIADTHSDPAASVNPIIGFGIGRHPLYGCLWQRSQGWPKQYAALQWHLLWAHVYYLCTNSEGKLDSELVKTRRDAFESYGDNKELKAFPNFSGPASKSVRELARNVWGPLLMKLKVGDSAKDFATDLMDVSCPHDIGSREPEWQDLREPLHSFLYSANRLGDWGHSAGGKGNSSVRYTKCQVAEVITTPGDPDDPDAHWPAARWISISGLEKEPNEKGAFTREELLEFDLDPDEIVEPEECYLVAPEDIEPDYQHLAVLSAMGARGQLRHMQMLHQLLPWDYGQLSLHELAWCLHECSNAVRELGDRQNWGTDQFLIAELVTLTHVMLWTGSSLERACDLRVSAKGQIRKEDLFFELGKNQWRIHAAMPDYKSVILDPDNQAYPPTTYFLLPDVARTRAFIDLLLLQALPDTSESDLSKFAGRQADGFLFLKDEKFYRSELTKWLKHRPNQLTGRVTVGRISTFLFNRLLATTGDLMAAVLITGRSHPQARSEQFYASYSVAQLRSVYLKATSIVVQEAYLAADLVPPEIPADTQPEEEAHVGARLCATYDAVQKAVRRLQNDLKSARQIKDQAGSIVFHNLYTLYTILMFAYATSIRAIRTPYLSLDEVDTIDGFAFISDKDNAARNNTRQAWIPPFVIRQMAAYADHLQALSSDNPHVIDYMGVRKDSREQLHQPCEICFFLDLEGKPIEVRPKTISEHMKPYLALPPNVHRRFMRYALLSKGRPPEGESCPPEVVMAWLGHAFQGEEQWGPYSTLGFDEYRTALEHFLLPILEDLGWKTLTSPLC